VGWPWRRIVWQTGTTAWETRCFFLQGTKRKDGGKRFLWNICYVTFKKNCTLSPQKHDMAQLSTLMLRCLSIPLLNPHYIYKDSVRTSNRTACFHCKHQSRSTVTLLTERILLKTYTKILCIGKILSFNIKAGGKYSNHGAVKDSSSPSGVYLFFHFCENAWYYLCCSVVLVVLFGCYLCCSMYCLYVNVYCHRVTNQLQLINHIIYSVWYLALSVQLVYCKVGYTLVTLPRIVTPYRDSVDGTRDRVTYQKLVTR
jgi:hypothetical protein